MRISNIIPSILFSVFSLSMANQIDANLKLQNEAIGYSGPIKSLEKTSASSTTYYKSPLFNFEYTAPSGWSFTSGNISEGASGTNITWQGAPGDALWWLTVAGYKRSTSLEAEGLSYKMHFQAMNLVFAYVVTKAPLIYYLVDTTIENVHYLVSKTKDNEQGRIIVKYSASNSLFTIEMDYSTTIADFEQKENTYLNHWKNLLFLYVQPATVTKLSTNVLPSHNHPEGLIINVLGQIISENRSFYTVPLPLK